MTNGRRKSDGTHYIGNLSFTKKESTEPKIVVRAGRLCPSVEPKNAETTQQE